MSYDNLSSVSQNVLKFYQQLTGEERRIAFIFDDFHFCRHYICIAKPGDADSRLKRESILREINLDTNI
jgi:hypothetical protein